MARKRQGHHVGEVPADEGTQAPAARFLVTRLVGRACAMVKEQDFVLGVGKAMGQVAAGRTRSDNGDAHSTLPWIQDRHKGTSTEIRVP